MNGKDIDNIVVAEDGIVKVDSKKIPRQESNSKPVVLVTTTIPKESSCAPVVLSKQPNDD